MKNIRDGIIIGISIAAISASAKAFLDIEKLKANYKSQHDIIKEIHQDVRELRNHILN